ncbi:MAG TPA: fatty acid oxidation complex subunit alpha FadJ, partial [Myxococcaceae bacterium]|nr:fatty acid oxidation complex subunit alpha FadJ [Myxococcaceae bacterium]
MASFRTEMRDDVAVVTFDLPGETVNTLSPAIGGEFGEELERLGREEAVKAIVFASAKQDFVVGADVKWLGSLRTAADAEQASREAQHAFDRLAFFPKPVVAAIHGACLGGGLEWALACRGRVASDAPRTQLGVPEVQLGLLPGAGGTQRLPRLIGLQAALDLILTGKSVRASKARKLGLVDEVVPESILVDVAVERARALAAGAGSAAPHRSPRETVTRAALEGNPIGRRLILAGARKQVLKKTGGHYPAPERALDVVREGLERGIEAGLRAEARAFGELLVTEVSARLRELFFATTALKKDTGVDGAAKARPVHKLGMLGGGLMGGGIAFVTAETARLPVRIKERDDASVGNALAHVRRLLDQQVRKRRLDRRGMEKVLARVSATTDLSGFHRADVVVEAVPEVLDLKKRLLAEVEAVTADSCVFASNTSSLPITRLAEGARRPGNVIGMHYFSPVEKLPLLEVIPHAGTDPSVIATCVELGKKQGKTVIVVRDGPGFYTSRILAPYLNEAAHLLVEGAEIEAVDRSLRAYGFPVGPFQLLDEVGFDIGEKVSHVLHEALGERMTPPETMAALIKQGRLGKKVKKGFYRYDVKGKQVDPSVYESLPGGATRVPFPEDELRERPVLLFLNEAVRCLEEGILRSARDGDIGAVFGLGFPPFRGGPFRAIDAMGVAEMVQRLEGWKERKGVRFEPAPLLRRMAERGERFHPVG